jgi:Beta-propeller repeat
VQNTNNGGIDAFVTKFNSSGSGLVYSTYLGGGASDTANAIALDSADNAYITGYTASSNYPTANALRPTNGGGNDVFVSKITNLNGYSISGRVADDSGTGRSGVTVSITGTQKPPP